MTPEPTGGFYKEEGFHKFIKEFGYDDTKGRADRRNFGGVHRTGIKHARTGLTMTIIGFDKSKGKVSDPDGRIALMSADGIEAASWNFSALFNIWNTKHARAAYVPGEVRKLPETAYRYASKVMLGIGTDFNLFLKAMAAGAVYFDPGMKLENVSTDKPTQKKRSQFRVISGNMHSLYHSMEEYELV